MSGGTFEYEQHHLSSLAEEIDENLKTIKEDTDEWDATIPKQIQNELQSCSYMLKRLFVRIQRLDWYLAGDDSIKSYNKRLREELKEADDAYWSSK